MPRPKTVDISHIAGRRAVRRHVRKNVSFPDMPALCRRSSSVQRRYRDLFVRSFCYTLLLIFCLTAAVAGTLTAGGATRSVGFGDSEPAMSILNEGHQLTVTVLGAEFSWDLAPIKQAQAVISQSYAAITPPIIRVAVSGLQPLCYELDVLLDDPNDAPS